MKSLIWGSILVLATVCLLPAQLTNASATAANSVAVTPTGQAPDDVIKKLSELIHAGKYPEAQQMTVGLLAAYPDDQRLIKAKTLLDKLLVVSSSSQPTNSVAQPATEQLTGMDKVDYNALIQRAREAQQTTDLDQQKILLQQFMVDSSEFLQKHPDQILIWQFRAVSAISLDDIVAGNEAGQKLLSMGAANSNDPNLQQLLAQLKNKGWFDQQSVAKHQKFAWLLGNWDVDYNWHWDWNFGTLAGSRGKEDFVWVGSSIEGHEINNTGTKCPEPDLRGTILESGEINWECYLPPSNPGELYFFIKPGGFGASPVVGYLSPDIALKSLDGIPDSLSKELVTATFYPSGWQPVISYATTNASTMTIVIPSQNEAPNSKNPMKHPVTLTFKKDAMQNQPSQPQQ